jgi:nucleotide-binding universal stress UspA family protein
MGQRLLDEQVKRVEEAGGTVAGAHFRMARPDQGILAVGEDIGTGLIVLGSRGLGGVKRALMGSVSDSVVRHAHCPVLVVRKEDGPDQKQTDQEMLLA